MPIIITVILCITLVIASCASNKNFSSRGIIDFGKESELETSHSESEIFSLGQNDTLDMDKEIDSKDIFVFDNKLKTNSEKIIVKNMASNQLNQVSSYS